MAMLFALLVLLIAATAITAVLRGKPEAMNTKLARLSLALVILAGAIHVSFVGRDENGDFTLQRCKESSGRIDLFTHTCPAGEWSRGSFHLFGIDAGRCCVLSPDGCRSRGGEVISGACAVGRQSLGSVPHDLGDGCYARACECCKKTISAPSEAHSKR